MIYMVPIFIFLTVYTVIYQLYLSRQMRLSLSGSQEAISLAEQKPGQPKENPLRRILKSFAFLANFKFSRSLAFLPAKERLNLKLARKAKDFKIRRRGFSLG